jgi:hypothetical protein
MDSLLNSEMTSLELFRSLSHEEQMIYAGLIHSVVVDSFNDPSKVRSIPPRDFSEIMKGFNDIIDIFIELELVEYLEDIIQVKINLEKIKENV